MHQSSQQPFLDDPVAALAGAPGDAVLAVITGVEGPSYRPVGALMAFLADGSRAGSLSSGCIEGDLARQAAASLDTGKPVRVRYGRGSPYLDIALPCGGGLDILLVPRPDAALWPALLERRAAREPARLIIDPDGGRMFAESGQGASGWRDDGRFAVAFEPPIAFHIFGKGPETVAFAGLASSLGHPVCVLSPDDETRAACATGGARVRDLARPAYPPDLSTDMRTAVVLFFHDHDWEPDILAGALATPAFYIGAQGSRRARDARHLTLQAMGLGADDLARLYGPVGLIPSARDPATLAVSVLAEILARAASPD